MTKRRRILALDYGSANTGAALSDPGGSIVRPLDVVEKAASAKGQKKIADLVTREEVGLVIVGMPVTLSGEKGSQARETAGFVASLRDHLDIPVHTWDERFTSKLAAQKGRGSTSSPHSIAACCLLEDYLESHKHRQWIKDLESDKDGEGLRDG